MILNPANPQWPSNGLYQNEVNSGLGRQISSSGTNTPTGGLSFGESLNTFLNEVSEAQNNVGQQSVDLANGSTDSIQELAINASKADLAFQFVIEVRNRLIATYQDVMRMQI